MEKMKPLFAIALLMLGCLHSVEYELFTFANGAQIYRPKGAIVRKPQETELKEKQVQFNELTDYVVIDKEEAKSDVKETEKS